MRDHLIDVVGIGTLGFWAVCFGVYNGNLTQAQGSSGAMLVVGNERVSCVRRGSRAPSLVFKTDAFSGCCAWG